MKVKKIGFKFSVVFMSIFIVLSVLFTPSLIIFGIVLSVVSNAIILSTKVPEYSEFYYRKFFPELLKSNGIYDLKRIDNEIGAQMVRDSGLSRFTNGSIKKMNCFESGSHSFSHFGYYKKIKRHRSKNGNTSTTTFDGLFFIRKVPNNQSSNLKLVGFKTSKSSTLSNQYYSGKVFVNNKSITLSKESIKMLRELENEFGRLYISINNGYLAVQFLKFGTCQSYRLYPYLKHGKDTEDHFKIINLSNRIKDIDYIISKVLEDVSKTHFK